MSEAEATVHLFEPDAVADGIPGELADIRGRVEHLLRHWKLFNRDEAKVREQQHGMVRDGCFIMPSPFSDSPDTCYRSYYLPHVFFYEFDSTERYYWITSDLSHGYALAALYFPQRRVAIKLYPHGPVAPALLRQFATMLASVVQQQRPSVPAAGHRTAVVGYSQFMHMLWNELPALDHVARSAVRTKLKFAVTHQPFGPTASLFPELADDVSLLRYQDVPELNSQQRLLVGLGARTITKSVQDRVRAVANHHAAARTILLRDQFRGCHTPVFWFSVKPPDRTCLQQGAFLTALIAAVKRDYPKAGIILNGASLPWDYHDNSNYQSWFREGIQRAVTACRELIDDVHRQLPASLQADVTAVSDVSACDEIVWGESADFYFCHGGTMQNKIGWIHRIPGMIHSNTSFMTAFKWLTPVVDGPKCFYLTPAAIIDDDPRHYSELQLARKDQNYSFASLDQVTREFLDAFATSRASAGVHSPGC